MPYGRKRIKDTNLIYSPNKYGVGQWVEVIMYIAWLRAMG
jgi:hypothetical protein